MLLFLIFPIVLYLMFEHSEKSPAVCFPLDKFCRSSQFSPILKVLNKSVVFASTSTPF